MHACNPSGLLHTIPSHFIPSWIPFPASNFLAPRQMHACRDHSPDAKRARLAKLAPVAILRLWREEKLRSLWRSKQSKGAPAGGKWNVLGLDFPTADIATSGRSVG